MNRVSAVQFFRTHERIATTLLLVAVWGGIFLIADYHDIFRRITANSDQDLILTYNALLFNEGLPQQYFDHTGYVYFLILSTWLKLLHGLGLLPISAFGELNFSQSSYGNLEQLIYAGRYLSIILSALLTTVFFFGMRRFTGNFLIAGILALMLAISPGISVQVLVMRTELPAMLFVLIAFFLGVTPPRKSPYVSHAMLFGAAFFVTLGMMTKVQVVPFAIALPALFLMFIILDKRPKKGPVDCGSPKNSGLLAISLFAVSVPAQSIIWSQVFWSGIEQSDIGGWYQVILALTIIGLIIFYSVFLRFKIDRVFLCLALVSSGISFATYFNFFYYNLKNTYVVTNFFEHMSKFSGLKLNLNYSGTSIEWLTNKFSNGVLQAIGRDFDITQIINQPFVVLYWFVLVGGILALIRRDNKIAAISLGLLGLSIGMEAFTSLRYWADHYRIFTEVWILIATGEIIAGIGRSISPSAYFERLAVRKIIVGSAFIVLTMTAGFSADFALKARVGQSEKNACYQVAGLRQPYEDLFCRLNK